jgi:hypothetical protein
MTATLELENGKHITYKSAITKDENIINEAIYPPARKQLYQELCDQRAMIQVLFDAPKTADEDAFVIQDQWIRGSFTVCITVEIRSAGFIQRLIFRCPMSHKLAEAKHPGTIDEKLSCEVGAYVWM